MHRAWRLVVVSVEQLPLASIKSTTGRNSSEVLVMFFADQLLLFLASWRLGGRIL
jgi:hypothetical protein